MRHARAAELWQRLCGKFNAIYPDLAKSFGVPLYPFFLDGVAADTRLNQADGMHPTAEGVDIVVKNILPTVEAFLGKLSGNGVETQHR